VDNSRRLTRANVAVYYRFEPFKEKITENTIQTIRPHDYYLPYYSFIPTDEFNKNLMEVLYFYLRPVPMIEVPSNTTGEYETVPLYSRPRDIRHGDLVCLTAFKTEEETTSTLFMVIDKKISKTLEKFETTPIGLLVTAEDEKYDFVEIGTLRASDFYYRLLPEAKEIHLYKTL